MSLSHGPYGFIKLPMALNIRSTEYVMKRRNKYFAAILNIAIMKGEAISRVVTTPACDVFE